MKKTEKVWKVGEFKSYLDLQDASKFLLKDFKNKKIAIKQKNLDNFENNCGDLYISSWERVKAERVLFLLDYLNFLIIMTEKKKIKLEEDRKDHIKKNLMFLLRYVNNLDEKLSFITPQYLYQFKMYTKTSYLEKNNSFNIETYKIYDKTIGRLYGENSIQNISRTIRFLLFKDEYQDFDIAFEAFSANKKKV